MSERERPEGIYDDFEFDPNLEIYWDALENSLESTLDIVPPSNELLPPSPEKLPGPVNPLKHKREEIPPDPLTSIFDFPETFYDDQEIKATRFGSLGRIMANSAQANILTELAPIVPVLMTSEAQDEARKVIVSKFIRCLNFGDMNGLAKVIRENCRETCFLMSPDLYEPIMGKGDIMMLFSLLFEAYPDGVWNVGTLVVAKDGSNMISCLYRFTGTGVFCHSINTLFLQIRAHSAKFPVTENHEEFMNIINTNKMVNDVAEFCHPVPNSLPPPVVLSPTNSATSSRPVSGVFLSMSPPAARTDVKSVNSSNIQSSNGNALSSLGLFGSGSPPAVSGKSFHGSSSSANSNGSAVGASSINNNSNIHSATVPGMPHLKLNNSFNIPSATSKPVAPAAPQISNSSSHGSVLAREFRKVASPPGSFSDNGTPRNLLCESPTNSSATAAVLGSNDDNDAINIPRRRGSIKIEAAMGLSRTNSVNNNSFYNSALSSPRNSSEVFLELSSSEADVNHPISITRRTASIKDLGLSDHLGHSHNGVNGFNKYNNSGAMNHSLPHPVVTSSIGHVSHHPPPPPTVSANTKVLETNVLKNGPVTQRRKMEFVFDEFNGLIRIVISSQ